MLIADVLATLSHYPTDPPLPAPEYVYKDGPKVMLAVPSMERHMSDEGWQLALAFEAAGYKLHGHNLGGGTNVPSILTTEHLTVVMVMDQHEWDQGHLAVPAERFIDHTVLASKPDVFKLTVVKDTHRQYVSARENSKAIGCHAWLTYYNIDVSIRTLSWLRRGHTIRTYHTVDRGKVPPYSPLLRRACLLSGSLGGAYPLRTRIHAAALPDVDYVKHPGYSNKGTSTPDYLKLLSGYKVAVCTASKFGYTLRKLIEATACGCRVITDLPYDEVLPGIDANLVRVEPGIPMGDLHGQIRSVAAEYDPEFQARMARVALETYDYRVEGHRVAAEIERVRNNYKELA